MRMRWIVSVTLEAVTLAGGGKGSAIMNGANGSECCKKIVFGGVRWCNYCLFGHTEGEPNVAGVGRFFVVGQGFWEKSR